MTFNRINRKVDNVAYFIQRQFVAMKQANDDSLNRSQLFKCVLDPYFQLSRDHLLLRAEIRNRDRNGLIITRNRDRSPFGYKVEGGIVRDLADPCTQFRSETKGFQALVNFYKNLLHEVTPIFCLMNHRQNNVKDEPLVPGDQLVKCPLVVFKNRPDQLLLIQIAHIKRLVNSRQAARPKVASMLAIILAN